MTGIEAALLLLWIYDVVLLCILSFFLLLILLDSYKLILFTNTKYTPHTHVHKYMYAFTPNKLQGPWMKVLFPTHLLVSHLHGI